MQRNPPVFAAEQVSCVVPSLEGDRTVFSGLAFSIARGEIVDLMGPSGSGKSSLLTAFARLNPHASGSFALDGVDAASFTPQQWRREVAYLPQKPILPGDTVAQAIRLPFMLSVRAGTARTADGGGRTPGPLARLARLFRDDASRARDMLPDARIRQTLDAMGCGDIDLERRPHDLSGGQAARVSLARTLLTEPRMLLADEVDAGLDDGNADKVASIMTYAAGRGMAIVRIRHRPPDGQASRIVTLADGTLHEDCVGAATGSAVDGKAA